MVSPRRQAAGIAESTPNGTQSATSIKKNSLSSPFQHSLEGGPSARQLRSYPTEIQVTKRLRHARKPIPAAILCQGQSPTKTVGSEAHLRMRLDRRRTGREEWLAPSSPVKRQAEEDSWHVVKSRNYCGERWDEYRENVPSYEYMCSILSKVLREKRPTARPRMESKPPSPPTAARAFPCCLRRIAILS